MIGGVEGSRFAIAQILRRNMRVSIREEPEILLLEDDAH
jgi:hypothetical protein